MKLLSTTNKQLANLERMAECAYLNGFDFDESKSPRLCARELIQDLRESIEHEMILARGRGIVATALHEVHEEGEHWVELRSTR